jgi:hypothetical protein
MLAAQSNSLAGENKTASHYTTMSGRRSEFSVRCRVMQPAFWFSLGLLAGLAPGIVLVVWMWIRMSSKRDSSWD